MHRHVLLTAALCLSLSAELNAQPGDPSTMFPLAAGNEWEYEHYLYRPLTQFRPVDESETRHERYRILTSSTERDTLWYSVAYEERTDGGLLIRRDTARVRWDEQTASIIGADHLYLPSQLKCLDGVYRQSSEEVLCFPFVNESTAYVPDVLGPDPVESITFANYVWSIEVVAHIGVVSGGGGCEPCGVWDDRDSYTLRYARIDDKEYGARIVHRERTSSRPGAQSFSVYPNPTRGVIHLVGFPGERLAVIDLLGRRVRDLRIQQSDQTIDLGDLPPGVYLLAAGDLSTLVALR